MFRSNLVLLIDYKWEQVKHMVHLHGLVYIVYAILLVLDAHWLAEDGTSKIVLGGYSVILFLKELLQMYLDGGPAQYLGDPFNWFDFFG